MTLNSKFDLSEYLANGLFNLPKYYVFNIITACPKLLMDHKFYICWLNLDMMYQ